ncbi:VOC family protein [Candidatus Bipolaricaulota bacterium]|nr:VOC family protein [Candidatus Bipolaricaulota bacterium]
MANGDFCHIELKTTDIDKTRSFYESIFAWTFQIFPGMETYAMFTTPSGLGGAFDSGPNAEPPSEAGPILHIEVDDIEATLARIAAVGGKAIVPKTKISDEFGHYALFLDNVGNRLGLWSR